MSCRICKNILYPVKELKFLPLSLNVVNGQSQSGWIIDYALETDLATCKTLLVDAAKKGLNVGEHEFHWDQSITDIFPFSDIFVLKSVDPCVTNAFFCVRQSLESSSVHPSLAEIRLVLSEEVSSNNEIVRSLVRAAEKIIIELDVGYFMAVINVALCCQPLVNLLREENYHITATTPNVVHIAGFGIGTNLIFVKKLLEPLSPKFTREELTAMFRRIYPDNTVEEQFQASKLRPIPYLPCYGTDSTGMKFAHRQFTANDAEAVYGMMSEAVDKGDGYSYFAYPGLAYFKKFFLSRQLYGTVFENASTGEVFGFLFYGHSRFNRDTSILMTEGVIYVKSSYRNRKAFSKFMETLYVKVHQMLNDKAEIGGVLVNNMSQIKMIAKNPTIFPFVGIIPFAFYIFDKGWRDKLVVFVSHENNSDLKNNDLEVVKAAL